MLFLWRIISRDFISKGERTFMKSRIFRVALVAAGMLFVAGARDLRGWGKTWMGLALKQAIESAKWKFGPLSIAPAFYLTDAGYDTNLYYGSGGAPVKDYTMTVGPGIAVHWPLNKKLVLQVVESPRYVYYHETKNERAWNNFLNARINLAFNRIFIMAGWGFTSARQRLSTEVEIRPRRKEKIYEGAVLWQASKRTSFYIQGRRTKFDFEDLSFDIFNLRDRLNRTEDRLSLRTYYQLTNRARFFVSGEFGNFAFEREVSGSKGSRSYGLFGGVEFAPLSTIRGQVNIGYKVFEPLDRTWARFQGLAGNSSLSVRLLRFLTVRSSYSRDIQLSVWYDNAYYIENRAGGGASLYILKRFRLDYDYWDGRNRYPESQVLAPGAQVKKRDNYRIHSIGFYFQLKRNIGIGLVANRWNRDSNLVHEVGSRDFIGMNLTYDF
jgi:hypothetical protein